MKKSIYLISGILFLAIASCSGPQSKEDQLKELKAQKQECQEKTQELEKQIASLQKEVIANGGEADIEARKALVETTEVVAVPFRHFIEVQGNVESDNNIFIPAEYPGIVQEIKAEEGDYVKKGDILAILDAKVIESQIEELKTGLELAKTVYERQKRLWDKKIGSEIQYLQAKNTYEGLEKKLATVMEQYETTRIISPIDGMVDEIVIKEGEMAAAGFGAIRVVKTSELSIKAPLSETYISEIMKGDSVYVSIPGAGIRYSTKITTVSNVIDPGSRTFNIEVEIPANIKNIHNNMIAVLQVNDYSNDKAFVVPVNLVQNTGSSKFLFVAAKENNEWLAEVRTVTTGKNHNNNVEILDGLKEGDIIISSGYQNLANRQPLTFVH